MKKNGPRDSPDLFSFNLGLEKTIDFRENKSGESGLLLSCKKQNVGNHFSSQEIVLQQKAPLLRKKYTHAHATHRA